MLSARFTIMVVLAKKYKKGQGKVKKGHGKFNLGRRKMKKPPSPILKYECVHDDEVAGTAAHNE